MKVKSLVRLLIVLALTIVCGLIAVFGSPEVGKYSLKPFGEAISLGLDLRGGMYTVYQATDDDVTDSEMLMAIATLRERLDRQGYTEASVTRQGTNRVRVEIPDVNNPDEVMGIIGKPAKLEFIDHNGNVIMDGSAIVRAEAAAAGEAGSVVVLFELNEEGTAAFAEATTVGVGKQISIVLDGETISQPMVNEPITTGEGSISGMQSREAAQELATLINSGALPVELEQLELRTVSATLGVNALDNAVLAGGIGIICVMLFMLLYYRLPGLVSCLALAIYTILLFLVMITVRIQLTLPGLAGVVLSIGMAIDANIIIFERFREELRTGKTLRAALEAGFKRAFTAIFDSNITSIFAAMVLAFFGTGPVKGFAYTLAIGVILSMFTAIVVTRFLLRNALSLGIANKGAYAPIAKEVAKA